MKETKMKTVKQKLEQQLKRIVDKFPDLETNKVYMGSKYHNGSETFSAYQETCLKVGTETIEKYRNLKYILNIWNSDKSSADKNFELLYQMRNNKMYGLANLLSQEIKQQKVI